LAIHHYSGQTIGIIPASKICSHIFFSFARKHKCSISYFLDNEVERIFSLPLSIQAAVELEILQSILDARDWDLNTVDNWVYNSNTNRFRSKKVTESFTALRQLHHFSLGFGKLAI
jgi:hypothetical protein